MDKKSSSKPKSKSLGHDPFADFTDLGFTDEPIVAPIEPVVLPPIVETESVSELSTPVVLPPTIETENVGELPTPVVLPPQIEPEVTREFVAPEEIAPEPEAPQPEVVVTAVALSPTQPLPPSDPVVIAPPPHKKSTGVLSVFDRQNKQVVAKIILNGYNIEKSTLLGQRGAMRSFKVVTGSLWEDWNAQRPLILHGEDDQEARIKVAALPVEEDGFGLIEFI